MARPRASSRIRRFAQRMLAAFVIAAALLAWPLAHAGTALIVERDVGPPDAIITLASHEWERLPAAAALARRHAGAIVLLTLPQNVTAFTCHRCSERVEWLEAEGIARERVRVLGRTLNTYGEAMAAREHARSEPVNRLVVVTSPYHTRRALATFEKVFAGSRIAVGVTAANPARSEPRRWWLDPYDRFYVRYEWAALLLYRAKYGVRLSRS